MEELHKKSKIRLPKPSIVAFVMPVMILALLYIIRGVFPFGDNIYVRMDFYHQYAPFAKEFCRRILNGESLLYAWEYGLGINYWAHYAYYLASPANFLLVFIPGDYIVETMNLLLILKAGVAGTAFVYFLKENRKENMVMAAFGIFYALSGYFLAYSGNVIWMDGYALFPLVALGILRITRGKSAKLYTVTMLICTFSNFYLAVIIGICSLLWLLMCLITGRKKSIKMSAKAIVRFILFTALYVGLCAVILLPVAYALMNTPAGDSTFPEKTEFYFALYELFERMCINADCNLKGSDLPNIYASVLVLVLLPMYFGNKAIRLKDKIVYGFVLLFMLASFEVNALDYIWHGLHFPNSFPARQSFFYIFLVLVMGYEAYAKRKKVSLKFICISVPAWMVVTSVAWFFLGKEDAYAGTHIYLCTLLFIFAYGLIFILERNISKKVSLALFLSLCVLEAGVNTCVTGVASVVNRESYMEDDSETQGVLTQIMPEENTFYRVEEIDRRTVNDAGWDGYYGASYFSSTMPAGVKEWYDAFGMRNSNVSYSFDGATPLTTSLLNIRYVFASEEAVRPGNTYAETEITVADEVMHLYENTTVLPLGYMVDSNLEKDFVYNFSNPFITLNNYASAVLKENRDLFEPIVQYKEIDTLPFDVGAGAESALEEGKYEKERIAVEIPANENVFLYVTTYMEAIDVEIRNKETGEVHTVTYDDLKFKKIISLGVEDVKRTIVVSSADASVNDFHMYSYRMNEKKLAEVCDVLREQPMEIKTFSDREITGCVDVSEEGVLLLSIPFDKGWTVKADGMPVETFAWKDAFLALELPAGEHELEFSYCPVGFKEGMLISIFSAVVALILIGCDIKKHKRTVKK